MGDTLVLTRAASHHLLHVLEPRQAQPYLFALRWALISIELAPIANVRVYGVVGEPRDGASADERRREKPRRGRSFGGHARAIEGDCGIRRLRRVIGDAELTG